MKKRFVPLVALVALFVVAFSAAPVLAEGGWSSFGRTGNGTVSVGKDETKDGSVYLAGDTVDVAGTVNGDVYAAGKDIHISGTVNGDVLVAAQNVTVDGTVSGSVRAAAQNINVGGKIGGAVSAFAQNVWLNSAATTGGDLNGGAMTYNIDGTVGKNLRVGAETVNINGTITGVSDMSAQTINVGSAAKFGGDVSYESATDQNIAKDKVGTGVVHYNYAASSQPTASKTLSIGEMLLGWLIFAVVALVTTLVLTMIAPNFVARSGRYARANLGRVILIGIAFVFATPALLLAFSITVVGIPLAIIAGLAWTLVLLVSGVFAAYLLGDLVIGGSTRNILLRALVGAVLLAVLISLPFVGIVVGLAACVLGSGMLLGTLQNMRGKQSFDETSGGISKKPARLVAKEKA